MLATIMAVVEMMKNIENAKAAFLVELSGEGQ
jgi:hypothetical protein